MPAVAGLRGTGDWATDQRPKNFREMIMWRQPNGTSPITALMSRVSKESTDDPEFNWWDEGNDLVRLLVNGALLAGATTVVVDSPDPDATNAGIPWGLATHLVPGDILMVEADTAGFANEQIMVTAVTNATTFTVTRGFAGTTAAAIADNAFLLKIGSAFAEGTRSPVSATRNPTKYFNYAQIFKTTYEITGTAEVTKTRTGDPVANDKKRKSFDHARDLELATIFGKRNETTGANGKPLRTMGGIRSFIPASNVTIFGIAITPNTWLDAVYKVFDWDTEAGDERIVFTGNAAVNAVNKMIAAQGSTNINYSGVIKQYGMDFREYVLPQGRLLLRTHPLFNRNDLYSKSMLVMDFSALKWRPMKGRDTKFQDNIQENDADTRKGQWMTEGGIEIRHGGLTLAWLGNIFYP